MTQTDSTVPSGKKKRGRKRVSASPVEVRDEKDPGDAVVRNFRYQHCYGVMLAVAGRLGLRPYVAIWCEQHEDFLAERSDGKFDGYQIKTSRPENGAWRINDPEMKKSLGRFVDLVSTYPDFIGDLYFVSNTECERVGPASTDDVLRRKCPGLLLEHIHSCGKASDVTGVFKQTFLDLQADFGCSADLLFKVLKRVQIVRGPSRNEMEAALSHEHIAKIEECKGLNAEHLNGFRDDLVATVYRASSLQVEDPIRHLRPVLSRKEMDPALAAKRLVIAEMVVYEASNGKPSAFQFVGEALLKLGEPRPSNVLKQKLVAGGLVEEVDYMQERERSTERHLLEDVARRPERYPELMKQIEQVVLGECREAHLRARQTAATYGAAMMIDVQNRLRTIAKEESGLIGDHSYECLVGMAGLLTSECSVWWSARFPIENEAQS